MLTRETFRPFFASYRNLDLFTPDFSKRHAGFPGLIRLFNDLRKAQHFDYVIDLHDVIRSMVLRFLFRITGVPVSIIDKGRREKKALITGKDKRQLTHSSDRYREVFKKAGYDLKPSDGPWIIPDTEDLAHAMKLIGLTSGKNIGVAPYAMHVLKLWPEEYMIVLMKMIRERSDSKFWLFGGREEAEGLVRIQKHVPGTEIASGRLPLGGEIALMSKLDFMISMDSSNMHMAALAGTKVISVWGATDPLAGFGAWSQPDEFAVRISETELTCRPCTVFGRGECRRGDHACMEWLTPAIVLKRLVDLNLI
jgi:ADP-heptose:LPS heptosyltransferase